jgi:hypothetical protein
MRNPDDDYRLMWAEFPQWKVRQMPHRCHVVSKSNGMSDEVPHASEMGFNHESP